VNVAIPVVLDRLWSRYPSLLVDAVDEHEPGQRMVATKNVTVGEDYFQGHFPGTPLMPAVLMIEALTQVATLLLLERGSIGPFAHVRLRGVDRAKFRRLVVPGDRLRFEVSLVSRRGSLVRARALADVGGQPVAEADLVLVVIPDCVDIDPLARVHSGACIGQGTRVGPFTVIGPKVRIGRNCRIGASAVIDGNTEIGDETEVFPFASIGLPPQDLKYKGEDTRLVIGARNIFRECVTIHRGTAGGGGITTIGSQNLFMGYVHIAHDCHVGSNTIFGPHATLGGHVTIEDNVNISAGSAVHQFCRVGVHAFIGGYSVITKDALPYGRTVGGRPARVYGLNIIGLRRRGFSEETLAKLRRAYRYLLQSKLNTSQALHEIENDQSLSCPEVDYLVNFIRTAPRGALLRRVGRRSDEGAED
jgi:UDP-N-acetylglucosamine acyltransferase